MSERNNQPPDHVYFNGPYEGDDWSESGHGIDPFFDRCGLRLYWYEGGLVIWRYRKENRLRVFTRQAMAEICLVILFVLALGIAGHWDYQDAKQSETNAAQVAEGR